MEKKESMQVQGELLISYQDEILMRLEQEFREDVDKKMDAILLLF